MATKPRNVYFPHKRITSDPVGESRTKQSFKKETDINFILAQSEKGLMVTHVNAHQGDYGNFINATDYHTSLNLINAADRSFMTVPASVRAQFNNDPQQFLEFVQNPDNLDEMISLGLANAPRPDPDRPKPEGTPKPPPAADPAPDPSPPAA